ncbi:MAG: TatD family hydrolase [bacterium]|nr:TatD family hydrolase [bacterium]
MSFHYIDIHSHVNFVAFDSDREETVKRALDAGVAMINVGTQHNTSMKAVELAEKYENGVFAIIGLHPVHTSKSFHDEKELGRGGKEFTSKGEVFERPNYEALARHPKVVGIGECGLDYYRIENDELRIKQEEAFRAQIELAIEVGKPLMLHLRNGSGRSAYTDAFRILSTFHFPLSTGRRPGNLHFFAGSIEEAKPFVELGYTFSFTGVVTFAKDYEGIVRYLPLESILSETDSPYVTPVPFRGKRNEPLYVREVVKAIARIRGQDEEKVREQILKNAETLFNIKLA